jgi:hypothetical protein
LTKFSEEMRLIEAAVSDPGSSGIVIAVRQGLASAASPERRLTRRRRGDACPLGGRRVLRTHTPLKCFHGVDRSDGADTVLLVRVVIEPLTSAEPGTTVVGVDDAHLLDDLSTFVLHQIVQWSGLPGALR